MNRQIRRTLAAGFATAMALAALFPVFQGQHWFWRTLGAVAVVTTSGLLTRSLRVPRVLQPLIGLAFLCAYLVLVFAPETLHNALPTGRTIDALRTLVQQGNSDLQQYGPPAPASKGLVLITASGVGAVALVVDLIAVLLDRVALSGLALLALFAVPSGVLPGGLGATTFAIGAVGWLALLLEEGSERIGRWGTPMRSALPGARPGGDDSSIGRVGRRIGAAALGLAVVVPVLVPGLDHRLLSGSGGNGVGDGNGPSQATTYNPLTTLKDQLTLPTPQQLLVYTTDESSPDYLRMTTLDLWNGAGWASSKLEADREHARVQKGISRPTGESLPTQDLTMQVAIDTDHLDVHWLPVPYGPRKVEVDGSWLWDPASQTVFSASRTTKLLKPYTVHASRILPTREALQDAEGKGVPADIASRYGTHLNVSPEVTALATRMLAGGGTPYEKAVAIQQWFTDGKHGFVYDTSPSQPRGDEDPLSAFLTGKHGFCEQYATAMAVLLRVAGLPSRVAVGFTAGQPVSSHKHTYSVTTSDAHAWPEAWFAGAGWVRFEPTPSSATGATTPDYTVPLRQRPEVTPSTGPQPSASPRALGPKFRDPDDLLKGRPGATPGTAPAAGTSRQVRLAQVALVLVPLFALVPWVATRLRRRRRAASPDPLLAWDQLADDATDVGAPWRASDSPRATAAGLRALLPEDAHAPLARLADAAELERYAPPGRASTHGLVADGVAVRRALQEAAPRLVRWRARLAPPSTIRWLLHHASERVADVLDLSDKVLGWLFQPVRRLLRV